MTRKRIVLGQEQVPIADMTQGEKDSYVRGEWPNRYRVKRLSGTIDYLIGQRLDSQQVEDLCEREDWQVDIE